MSLSPAPYIRPKCASEFFAGRFFFLIWLNDVHENECFYY